MSKTQLLLTAYFLILAAYGIAEIFLQRKSSDWKSIKHDKIFILLIASFYMSIYLPPLEFVIRKPDTASVAIVIGFLVLFLGIILRFIGLFTLGENFSVMVEAKPESSLVVNGIYKYIRHPLYLATLLISLSGSLIFSCLFTWIFFVMTLTGVLNRIKREESFLSKQFKEFDDYKKRTHILIPFIY